MALTSAAENLLDNAVKYSPPGAPVECEAEADGRQLIIRVRDRGYGIAAEGWANETRRGVYWRGADHLGSQEGRSESPPNSQRSKSHIAGKTIL